MTDKQTLKQIEEAKLRELTPEQREARERIDARNDAIQKAPIKTPSSGTFGKGKP